MSRPVEDCDGCPALAGVRNLGLDDPSAGRPDLHCNFGDRTHPGVSSGGKRDRESTESRRLSSVAERSRAAPARPAVEGGRAASSATPFLPSVLWCGERQPCNRRSLARATRRRLRAVDAGHTPPGFVDRGGDQQEHGQVRGPNLMSAPALVTATRALPAGPLRGQARGNHDHLPRCGGGLVRAADDGRQPDALGRRAARLGAPGSTGSSWTPTPRGSSGRSTNSTKTATVDVDVDFGGAGSAADPGSGGGCRAGYWNTYFGYPGGSAMRPAPGAVSVLGLPT